MDQEKDDHQEQPDESTPEIPDMTLSQKIRASGLDPRAQLEVLALRRKLPGEESLESEQEDRAVMRWLSDNSITLDSAEPSESLDDLDKLKDIIGNARLVGMGESTHGSREFSMMKHRMLRFLVEKMDFTGLIMEVPEEPAKKIDEYIQTGQGNVQQLLGNLGYWTTRTQEVADMVAWMGEYNRINPDKKIGFYGCDISINDERRQDAAMRDATMADSCIKSLGSDNTTKLMVWGHNGHIADLENPDFTSMGARLKDQLQGSYVNFGMYASSGNFLAREADFDTDVIGEVTSFELPENTQTSYARFFSHTDSPISLVDLRKTNDVTAFQSWREGNHTVEEVGSLFDPRQPADATQPIDLPNKYDGVIWMNHVSASTLLAT